MPLSFWKIPVVVTILNLIKVYILYIIARALIFKVLERVVAPMIGKQGFLSDAQRAARIETLQGMLKSVVGYLLFFIAIVMALEAIGVDTRSVLTTAGVLGLAVGFGAQRLVRDVISGFFILLENQFAVGEYVTMAGVTGVVEQMEMRVTHVRDTTGKLNIIANGDITTVCNHSRGAVAVTLEVSVSPDSDPKEVARLVEEATSGMAGAEKAMDSPFTYQGIVAMDGARVSLRFSSSCDAMRSEDVQMAARDLIRKALRDAGVSQV